MTWLCGGGEFKKLYFNYYGSRAYTRYLEAINASKPAPGARISMIIEHSAPRCRK